ncbi:phage portal protein [Streptomyces sp. NPDC102264]|uniref:phage portal protein n=1 Tax=Streptomyces sp. NPDC102264 TaxID=3366149 RepID=UPI0038295AFD
MGRTLLDPLRAFRNRTPVPFVSTTSRRTLGSLLTRPAGVTAQMRAVGASGTLFAIVDRIDTSYAQVEWRLWRKAKSGRKEDRVEVTSHAALDLWNQPNNFMSGPEFREACQQHEELTGEQWWVIARVPGISIPLELWPVRPDRIEPIPDPDDFIVGYMYRGPGGEQVPLRLDEVIFRRRPNPLDPFRGMGPVQTILTDLDATRYSKEWNRNFFINSAEPGGILEVDRRLSDEEFDEARERWAEQHRGVAAAHRVALLENGLKWVDRKYTMRDMQFAELGAAGRETIREAYGFPKPMLGAVDDVNRANADAAEVVLARWLVVPRLKRTRAALNTRLLPMFGATAVGLEFDFDNPVPEDIEAESAQLTARSAAAAALREAGWDPADILSAVGLPAMRYTAPATAASVSPAALAASWDIEGIEEFDAAMRWVAVCKDDDNSCQPCRDNDGRTYRNRAAAYKDYPGGAGYINCVGAEYGNDCRCTVVKRRQAKGDGE